VAPYSFTGTFTSPKVISPLHIARMPHDTTAPRPPTRNDRSGPVVSRAATCPDVPRLAGTYREAIDSACSSMQEVAMGAVPVQALRVVIWLSLAGSLVIQCGLVPLVCSEMHDSGAPLAAVITVAALLVLGVLGLQVVGVSILHLLTLVRRGR